MSILHLSPGNVPEEVYRRLIRLLVKKVALEKRSISTKIEKKKKIAQ